MNTQLKFCEPAIYFSEGAWLEKLRYGWAEVKALDERAKALVEKQGSMNWVLGDCLLEGVDSGLKPGRLKKHVLEVTGLKLSSGRLSNLMTVSRAIPIESSRRREDLPYSIHAEVAKFEPDVQDKLLDLAEEGNRHKWIKVPKEGWRQTWAPYSVREFRAIITKKQDLGELPRVGKASAKPHAEPRYQTISLRMTLTNGNYLEDLAGATCASSVEAMILTLLRRCITEHKEEFQAEIAKYHKMFPDPKTRRYGRPLPAQRPRM
jgi:hypothetical protein